MPRLLDSAIVIALSTGALFLIGAIRIFAYLGGLGLPENLNLYPPETVIASGFYVIVNYASDLLRDDKGKLVVALAILVVVWLIGKYVERVANLFMRIRTSVPRSKWAMIIIGVVIAFFVIISEASRTGKVWALETLYSDPPPHMARITLKSADSPSYEGHLVGEVDGLFVLVTKAESGKGPHKKVVLISKDETSLVEVCATIGSSCAW
jgi:hypothetical protein